MTSSHSEGLISTDAGGTPIHKWVDTEAAAKCSQITPTTPTAAGDVGTLFNPMVSIRRPTLTPAARAANVGLRGACMPEYTFIVQNGVL